MSTNSLIVREIGLDGAKTRSMISKRELLIEMEKQEQERKDLIDSFRFDDMFSREASIHPAAEGTCGWIFDESSNLPFASFTEWMQSEESVYWITGKAGSGKTTLMNYIWGYRVTDRQQLLTKWAAGKTLITAAVFFWNPGSELQKSVSGMLRTIIHQGTCR